MWPCICLRLVICRYQKSKIFKVLISGTPGQFLKTFGFKFLSFNRTIDLHCHLETFFSCVFPRLQNAKFENFGQFLKIFGFKFLSFNRTIDLHCHLETFFLCVFPRLQNAKFENVGLSKFLPAFDRLRY